MTEEVTSKKQYQDVGDAIGAPDELDKTRVERIIAKYEAANPGVLLTLRDTARNESTAGANEYGLISDTSKKGITSNSQRYMMELPEDLHHQLEEYIPTLFRSKKHFAWFCKEFKFLMIPSKR